MSRSSRLRGGLAVAAILAALPAPTLGHAIGQVFTLPVPLALYLAAAAAAVAASFVVATVVVRPPGAAPSYATVALPAGIGTIARGALRIIGLVAWGGTIVSGYLVDPASPLPAVLLWIIVWVGLPLIAIVMGNPWPSLSPFRSLFAVLEAVAGRIGLERLDAGLRYPAGLGRWPAVFFLFAAGWSELILPDHTTPLMVANLLIGYTLLTLIGMALFGRVAWLRNAELFEVLLGWFGRIGPVGRRVVDPVACEGCGESCDPARCIDCPECAVVAESGERRAELRPWFVGLAEVRSATFADAAFILLALATVTYDGLSETAFWARLVSPLFNWLWDTIGPNRSVLAYQTLGLLGVWLVFLAVFAIAVWFTRRIHDPGGVPIAQGAAMGAYAVTLLPIAAGYLIAHYFTLAIQGALWLPALLVDPLSTVAPSLDAIPVSAIWYVSVGAIVLGHIVAVVLAHRLALRDVRIRPVVAGLPLVVIMVGYTVLSLWIIASPITIEPGTTPAAMVGR